MTFVGHHIPYHTQRPSPRFRSDEYFVYEISEETFYPNLYRFVWRHHAGAHLDELQHGGRKPTSVTKFCYKSVNLFFERLINIKVILFVMHELIPANLFTFTGVRFFILRVPRFFVGVR